MVDFPGEFLVSSGRALLRTAFGGQRDQKRASRAKNRHETWMPKVVPPEVDAPDPLTLAVRMMHDQLPARFLSYLMDGMRSRPDVTVGTGSRVLSPWLLNEMSEGSGEDEGEGEDGSLRGARTAGRHGIITWRRGGDGFEE
eukprot:9430059-Pyramimonas_sp.AAC.1